MTKHWRRSLPILAMAVLVMSLAASIAADDNDGAADHQHMRLVAHNDLNGHGDGGEGMAIQAIDGRRILYLAHEGTKFCFSVVDVTNPKRSVVLNQIPSPDPGVTRCNSLGLSGHVLAVANQASRTNSVYAGFWLLDVSNLYKVQTATKLDDLAYSFFSTSGPHSRGVHWLWFVDGEFVHASTGAFESDPTHPSDDQFYMAIDVRNRLSPEEVGRWWLPGTQVGDECLPGCLPQRHARDDGFRAHNVEVFPEQPDRAYIGYIDGGVIILDISGLAAVKANPATGFTPVLKGRLVYSPPFPAWTHTVQPNFPRNLAIVSDEAIADLCADAPKLNWVVDIRTEGNPVTVGTAPLPRNSGALCAAGGRFGAHNLHPNFPSATSAQLVNTFVASMFNAGVRIYRLFDVPVPGAPPEIGEIGYYVPEAPAGNPSGTIQINHAIVDEKGLIYANDRITGGLYILEYTGPEPLD